MEPDGGGQTRLTFTSSDNLRPAWSPDGTKIAFESFRDGNAEIYVMNADGTNQTRLTSNSAADLEPAWSPDGSRLAFVSNRDGNDEIYVMNVDGTSQTNVSNNSSDDFTPAWSPDGRSLAFASNRDNHYEIYTMDAAGANQARVTNNADDDVKPFWSNAKITFQSNRDGNDQIYAMNRDGSGQLRLTNNTSFDIQPARSSDGSKIAFVSSRDDNFEIYLMNADGSNQAKLTSNPASDIHPSIQPLASTAAQSFIQFSLDNYSASEGAGAATITVTRTGSATGAAAIDYAAIGGTASDRRNFIPAYGTLNFAAGELSKTFTVLIIDNAFIEPNNTVNLTLSNPTGATLGAPNAATLTIIDNDSVQATTNPIDDSTVFVRQQYLDFLNRQPDDSGRSFWTAQIAACGSDAACVNRKRVDVSAAFFIEQEFQQTGFFLIRLYRAAFGRFPTYAEFIRDRSQLIGGGSLAATQTAFTTEFVNNRADFSSLYAATTNAQFIDKLNANTGGALSQAERDALVNGLNNGTETRISALIKLVNNATFTQQQFNAGFVLTEYFGYLRRDPDSDGFNFWLNILNNRVPGNFRAMVCAFTTSTEYQQRFSTIVSRRNGDCSGI
jgi:dipeptidyl aminopeptidase/acylaminoacyl peptidase